MMESSSLYERSEAIRELALYAKGRLSEWRDKFLSIGWPIDSIQIEGSLRSGLISEDSLLNGKAQTTEVDVLVTLPISFQITDGSYQCLLKHFKSDESRVLNSEWLGDQRRILNLTLSDLTEQFGRIKWDLHIVQGTLITCSPWWQRLFSHEEVVWQKIIRELCKRYLEPNDYRNIKGLQLIEAGWRLTAAFSLLQSQNLPSYVEVILDDLPIKDTIPPLGMDSAVKLWLAGETGSPGLVRPLDQLPLHISRTLQSIQPLAIILPTAPPWTEIAERFQWESCIARKLKEIS